MNPSRANQNETTVIVSFASQNPERQRELREGSRHCAGSHGLELRFPDDLTAAIDALRDAEILFTWTFTEDMFRAAPRLKWIHLSGAGADQTLFPDFRESDIVLTNSRGMHGPFIAEWTLGALLHLYQRFPEAENWRGTRSWQPHKKVMTVERRFLKDRTALIVGYGSIGSAVAQLLSAFGVRCEGIVTSPRAGGIPLYASHRLPDIISRFDIVINALPLTAGTRARFNADIFSRMKPGSTFVNVGRGKTVDESAMIGALRHGPLGYAALDVFAEEPLPETSELFSLPNVFMTPHVSGNFPDYSRVANEYFLSNLRRYLSGEPLENVVDKSRGY